MRRAALLFGLVSIAAGCGGGSDTHVNTVPTTPAATVRAWQLNWCRVQPKMTRHRVYAIMGPPTGEFPVHAGRYDVKLEADWTATGGSAPRPSFAAFFTSRDRATQLQAHHAKTPCAAVRNQQ